MNFFDFLDIQYVNKNLENQTKFLLKNEAIQKAAANLIKWQRNWFKFWAHFGLIFDFFKANLTNKFPEKITPKPKETPASDVTPA